MRAYLVIVGLIALVSAAPLGSSGPVKISDNNIENIFNININIQGVFTNNIEQDLVNVIVGLLNQQGITAGSGTLKEQLMSLAQQSNTNNLDINIPASALGQKLNFEGFATQFASAMSKKPGDVASEAPTDDVENEAKNLIQKFLNNNPELKLQ
ncbi:CLUMA_CG002376, isoform A [Clunio marinus]|uniref:CLUMA_CG002376, isoform A n=1 Tax=Clunio marinus TaxID=568069 RepID=A0A1J1HM63_9DIPT|nr:CLUMA_CG002376, isoform A [Clunio marinus]